MTYADGRNIMNVLFGSVDLMITCHNPCSMPYIVYIASRNESDLCEKIVKLMNSLTRSTPLDS